MEIVLRIDLASARWLRRALLLGIPLGAMAVTSVAVGAPPFVSGQVLKATDLNDMIARITTLETSVAEDEMAFKPASQIALKAGNNGTVSCDVYCASNANGLSTATCVGALDTLTMEYVSCTAVTQHAMNCWCSRFK